MQLQVKRKRLPDCENACDLLTTLQSAFPDFHLEAKVKVLACSIVRRPKIKQVYFK